MRNLIASNETAFHRLHCLKFREIRSAVLEIIFEIAVSYLALH